MDAAAAKVPTDLATDLQGKVACTKYSYTATALKDSRKLANFPRLFEWLDFWLSIQYRPSKSKQLYKLWLSLGRPVADIWAPKRKLSTHVDSQLETIENVLRL